jgi:phosphatidyl-myo-inositol alpha-mannosyltransferase
VRVALLCPYSLSRPGGVQGQVTGLAAALQAAGHEAVVLAPADGPVELPALAPQSFVALGRSVAIPANGSVAPVALSPGAAMRAVRAVRRGGFDVLHLHEPLVPGPAYACLVACDLPKVGTFHRAGTGIAYRLLGPLARHAAARLAARCAVSEQARATAQRVLGGTYEIVGNGIDLARFAAATPWPTRGPTVLFVGRHERRKGLEVLLGALGRMPAGVAPTVWVAGEGPDTERLRRDHASARNVEWLGRVGDDELTARLSGADILCAPSLGGESFGVVLLEAMAARTAVVASDLPGYADVARGHAVLVPPGDQSALARALEQAVSDAAGRTGTGAPDALDAAYAHASQWSMTTVAARYVALYQRVTAVQSPLR